MASCAAIVGVGLMGGSLGMALRRRGWRVRGVGRSEARLRKARALGAVDEWTSDLGAGVAGADVVVLAAPVDEIVPLARRMWPRLKDGAQVMDMGSVKGPIVKAVESLAARRPGADFVGAHPMCGSEKSGVENARADLFRGATCVLTPTPRTSRRSLRGAESFWRGVGARPLRLSPEEHDRRVALISHLPHLLAEALALAVGRAGGAAWAPRLAAGSFRDATRVAGADPALWASIFRMNRPAARSAAGLFRRSFDELVRGGPSAAALGRARRSAERLAGVAR